MPSFYKDDLRSVSQSTVRSSLLGLGLGKFSTFKIFRISVDFYNLEEGTVSQTTVHNSALLLHTKIFSASGTGITFQITLTEL